MWLLHAMVNTPTGEGQGVLGPEADPKLLVGEKGTLWRGCDIQAKYSTTNWIFKGREKKRCGGKTLGKVFQEEGRTCVKIQR